MEIAKNAKSNFFECEKCNYITHNRYDFKKHCQTLKHKQDIVIDDFSMEMEKSQTKKYQHKLLLEVMMRRNHVLIFQLAYKGRTRNYRVLK